METCIFIYNRHKVTISVVNRIQNIRYSKAKIIRVVINANIMLYMKKNILLVNLHKNEENKEKK